MPIINSLMLLLLVIFLGVFLSEADKNKIAYIDNVAVFSEFDYSKELRRVNLEKTAPQKRVVDSLYGLLTQLGQSQDTEALQAQFLAANDKLKQMNEYYAGEASQQIWNRLNAYAATFSKEQQVAILLGTQGNGNLMYAEEGTNLTMAFIAYANKRYSGDIK